MQMSVVAAIGSNTCTNHAATTEDYELKPIDFLPYTIKSSKNTRYYLMYLIVKICRTLFPLRL
ncbi:MAG TPA: hypothetical protein VK140_03635, partial [Ktedonobacteraceae bacterium]|nr:hypothetical protein [Ktedonobacteraceae bacterium]